MAFSLKAPMYKNSETVCIPSLKCTLSQKHFLGSKCFKILHEHFRDMGGAVLGGGGGTYISRYGRCCFEIWEVLCWGGQGGKSLEIWEVLFRDMGGVEICFWEAGIQIL